jgi:phenylacetate-CoA ligase
MTHQLDNQVAQFIANAYANAPGVRRWLDEAGVDPASVGSVADLGKIPVLTKDRLVELQAADPPLAGFLGVPMRKVRRIFISPGPLYEVFGDEEEWQKTGAALLAQAGFDAESIVLNGLSYHLASGGYLLDSILQTIGATIIPAGVGNAELQVKLLIDLGVTGYAGTPSWLLTILRKADELGVPREAIRIRSALLSAEPLAPADRATLVDDYGMQVINAYATAELGVLAYDTEGSPAMRLVDFPVVQLVDRETGEEVGPGDVGEVVVTNLNPTYPLIRFGTGDLAMNLDPAPGQSVQGERSIRLVGRIGDAVKVRGMFVHPNQLRVVMGQHGVTDYVARIRRPDIRDELTLELVRPAATDDGWLDSLQAAVRQICRVTADHIQFVEAVNEDAGQIIDERTWD